MKFFVAITLILLIDIVNLFSGTSAQSWSELIQGFRNEQKRAQTNCRFPVFSCRLLNKFRSTKRQTGYQSTSQSIQTYPYNTLGQESLTYPSYSLPVYGEPSYVQNYYQNYQNPDYPNPGNELSPMASSASGQYASYAPPTGTYTAQPYGHSANTIDVHQVLDQFIRSAGLSPQGDHEAEAAHASSFAKAGTSPVLVFKKLLSFPFYMSTDPNVADIYGKGWK